MYLRKSPALFAAALTFTIATPARASFHLMQINQVTANYYGDTTIQAIELRMRDAGQHIVSGARIRAHDAAGQNPVLIVDFQTNVFNTAPGSRVLIVSPNLPDQVTPDFTMQNLIPESYLLAGSLTYESDAGGVIWRLSWGGAAYTGPTTSGNDDNGDSGPPWPGSLFCPGIGALLFDCPNPGTCHTLGSTSNAADYNITSFPSFRNNAGQSFNFTPLIIAGDANCDATVDTDDIEPFVLGILDTNEYLQAHPCCPLFNSDINSDGQRNARDVAAFVELLLGG